jgi:hypothetical protein
MYVRREHWWNDIYKGKLKYWGRNLPINRTLASVLKILQVPILYHDVKGSEKFLLFEGKSIQTF